MSRLYKTEGAVLKHSYTGEADALLTLCTPERGKLRVIARGVRRPKSRLAGHLEPLTHCTMMLAEGRSFDIVSGCETLDSFQALRSDLWLLSCGLYVADLTDRLSAEGAENRASLPPPSERASLTLRRSRSCPRPSATLNSAPWLAPATCPSSGSAFCATTSWRPPPTTSARQQPDCCAPNCRGKEGLDRPTSVDTVKVLRFFAQNECSALIQAEAQAAPGQGDRGPDAGLRHLRSGSRSGLCQMAAATAGR